MVLQNGGRLKAAVMGKVIGTIHPGRATPPPVFILLDQA